MEFFERKGLGDRSRPEREALVRSNTEELARRKETNTIDPVDYELNYLYYLCEQEVPVGASDVRRFSQHPSGQAINITQRELEKLEEVSGSNLKLVLTDGVIITIESQNTGYSPDDRLVIFPEELGFETNKS